MQDMVELDHDQIAFQTGPEKKYKRARVCCADPNGNGSPGLVDAPGFVGGGGTPGGPPPGATARCRDGDYSHSTHHSGTCSGHGGVADWYTS